MDAGGIIVLIVVVVIVLGGGIGAVLLVKRRRVQDRARIEAMTPAERESHDAHVMYDTSLKAAEKAHHAELKAHENRVTVAQKAVAQAEKISNKYLGSYRGKDGSIKITETQITTGQGTFPLDASITAVADTAGNLATSSRSTLTRIAAGGLLFGPLGAIVGGVAKKNKLHDTRELYLLV